MPKQLWDKNNRTLNGISRRDTLEDLKATAIYFFEEMPADTTPERIAVNRSEFRTLYPSGIAMPDDLKNLLNQWFHYFDEGFASEYSIDELPDMIIKKLGEL